MKQPLAVVGWIAFTISGVLYLISGIQAGDGLVVTGSVIWLIGVGFFLMAIARAK